MDNYHYRDHICYKGDLNTPVCKEIDVNTDMKVFNEMKF